MLLYFSEFAMRKSFPILIKVPNVWGQTKIWHTFCASPTKNPFNLVIYRQKLLNFVNQKLTLNNRNHDKLNIVRLTGPWGICFELRLSGNIRPVLLWVGVRTRMKAECSITELTTCLHELSEYESTNYFTNISQFWAFEKIKTNLT